LRETILGAMVMDLSKIRIRENFGIVSNDTNTTQFNFLISPPKNRESIEKQDIVCFDHPVYGEACQILAEVTEVSSYEEVAGSTVGNRVGKMLATALIMGYVDLRNEDQPLSKLLAPPNPGSRVYMPYTTFLEDVFKRGSDGKPYVHPLHLGKAEIIATSQDGNDEQINYYLNYLDLISKHTLISATDGAGKTHTATIIIEELANKTKRPIVVFDPNNEYTTIGTAINPDQKYPFNLQTNLTDVNSAKNNPTETTKKIRQGQLTVITAENFTLTEKTDSYATILNILAKSRREKTTDPFLLVIEDAESLPPQAIQEMLTAKNDVATILITSYPTMLGGKALSQTGNYIVGKTNDPQDLACLKNMINGREEQLSSLGVGEWFVKGLNIVRPTKIYVRKRYSKPK
jgi:cellulose biosynthesis protein BcsQ